MTTVLRHSAGFALLAVCVGCAVLQAARPAPAPATIDAPAATAAAAETPEARFERADRNGDGAIDAEEFRNAMSRRFGLLDADGDGRLAGDEIPPNGRLANFADADGHLTLEQFQDAIPRVMKNIDSDGNGTLSLDELRNARRDTAQQEKQP